MSISRYTDTTAVETLNRSYTVGEVGATFYFDLGIDLSTLAATVAVTIVASPPSGTSKVWTGAAIPSAATSSRHGMKYVTVADDLDEAGVWHLTPKVSYNTGAGFLLLPPLRIVVRSVGDR